MIYSRLVKESAVDGAIQTPDDIGVDLDQVEKDIAGEDGIAAHQDEVEDAQEGMIGEPVEEFAMIMYESEYNYNQIMESIGMAELREASMGRELIYEAVDVKGFFEKIKNWIVKMFERLTQAVRKLLVKLDFQAKADKKFVEKNRVAIEAGAKNREWECECYPFADLGFSRKSQTNDYRTAVRNGLNDAKAGKDISSYNDTLSEKAVQEKLFKVFGVDASTSIEEFKEKLKAHLFGEKVKASNKKTVEVATPAYVINVLSNDRETRAIRDQYEHVKKGYKDILATIKEWEKAVNGADANITGCMHICQLGTRAVKSEQNIMHTAYGVYIQAAKAKRAQCRKLAHAWFGGYKDGKDEKKPGAKHEATSMFDAIAMI